MNKAPEQDMSTALKDVKEQLTKTIALVQQLQANLDKADDLIGSLETIQITLDKENIENIPGYLPKFIVSSLEKTQKDLTDY